jgi:hypothetical protein
LTDTSGTSIGRITTDGVYSYCPVPNYPNQCCSDGITAGPDGALRFTEFTRDKIGRAPACGLGFSAGFSGTTFTMNFNLGIATPATLNVLLHSSAGVSRPFSKDIPSVTPPPAFTRLGVLFQIWAR